MKIGVIADTHLEAPSPLLQTVVDRHFQDADMILHAGDIHAPQVLEVFGEKEVYAVSGNRDSKESKEKFPTECLIEAQGFRIGLTHGWGVPFNLESKTASLFKDVHCIVFGHSHWPMNRRRNGILFFNPGSFSKDVFSLWRGSIGVLTIERSIQGRIIRI